MAKNGQSKEAKMENCRLKWRKGQSKKTIGKNRQSKEAKKEGKGAKKGKVKRQHAKRVKNMQSKEAKREK